MRNNCAKSHIVNNNKGVVLTSRLLKFGIFVYMSPTLPFIALSVMVIRCSFHRSCQDLLFLLHPYNQEIKKLFLVYVTGRCRATRSGRSKLCDDLDIVTFYTAYHLVLSFICKAESCQRSFSDYKCKQGYLCVHLSKKKYSILIFWIQIPNFEIITNQYLLLMTMALIKNNLDACLTVRKSTRKINLISPYFYNRVKSRALSYANGHTTLNAPLLVRSAKLSNVGSGQYLDG